MTDVDYSLDVTKYEDYSPVDRLSDLWPWRDWMTIGIGVLATDASRTPKPNSLILLADTKGTFGATHSMNRLHKIFRDDEIRLYAVAADRIDYAAGLFTLLAKML